MKFCYSFAVICLLITATSCRDRAPLAQAERTAGDAELAKGNLVPAIDHFSKAIRFQPSDAVTYRKRAQATMQFVENSMLEGQLSDKYNHATAWSDLQTAVNLDPNLGEAHLLMGDLLLSNPWVGKTPFDLQVRRTKAIEAYDKAIELLADPKFAYVGRAGAYFLRQDRKKTVEDLARAIEMDPLNADFYSLRAYYASQLGDYRTAADDEAKAVRLSTGEVVTVEELRSLEADDSAFSPILTSQDSDEVQTQREQMSGQWAGEMNVRRFMPKYEPIPCELITDGKRGEFRLQTHLGDEAAQVEIRLDPGTSPPQIDFILEEQSSNALGSNSGVLTGIYDLESDSLTICIGFRGAARPVQFTYEDPYPNQRLFVLERVSD